MGLFTSLKKAKARMLRLYRRKKIGFRTLHDFPDGSKKYVYAKYRVINVAHELRLMDFLRNVQATEVRTGRFVDRRFMPDAEIVTNGLFYCEVDMGSEGLPQVQKQMEAYPPDVDVLWIAPTEERMKSLMSRTRNPLFWFTTNIDTPHEEVWTNIEGEITALPVAPTT